MADSTTIGSDKMMGNQRRAFDKPPSASTRSSFNPLHPSMELPPEQLIRLLGLESKKIRKPKRTHEAPVRKKAAPPPPVASLPSEPEPAETPPEIIPKPPVRPTHRQREYERVKAQDSPEQRRGLLMPALAIGLIGGIAASAYLFWPQSGSDVATQPPAPVASKVNRTPVKKSPKKTTPAAAVKARPAVVVKDDPAWQATINAQAKRLQTEAKQRLDQRLGQAPSAPTAGAVVPQADVITPAPLAPATVVTEPAAVTTEPTISDLQTPEPPSAVEPSNRPSDAAIAAPVEEPPATAPEDAAIAAPTEEPPATAPEDAAIAAPAGEPPATAPEDAAIAAPAGEPPATAPEDAAIAAPAEEPPATTPETTPQGNVSELF
ncbi:hypothetical protein MNBD_GAMMA13-1249 [hydrothermal vent metagenome]|uniref:Uncharacterized protein n=1 Tax=hydrothermal vent metagenome TaxID=652676 RepID=A0A3B0Z212_9ZZZZ